MYSKFESGLSQGRSLPSISYYTRRGGVGVGMGVVTALYVLGSFPPLSCGLRALSFLSLTCPPLETRTAALPRPCHEAAGDKSSSSPPPSRYAFSSSRSRLSDE
ncbi:hypothetical protein E2C01_050008 [Portunus trituberculatus]|uniref:Uncharacterized protein n=1 Tax=Portunus trituberculatus TaxID=210409 RepID=A0A5B7GG34_PORTR|nr:hypothetical protein [Portunus trituberculatus]